MNAAQALLREVIRDYRPVLDLALLAAILEELERAEELECAEDTQAEARIAAWAAGFTAGLTPAPATTSPTDSPPADRTDRDRADALVAVITDVERHLTDDGDVDAALAVLRGALTPPNPCRAPFPHPSHMVPTADGGRGRYCRGVSPEVFLVELDAEGGV